MQTPELKISQTLNVTYEKKRERYEGKREGQTQEDREIKKTVSGIITVHTLLTSISSLQ